jgi:hypothetical protein
MARAHQTLIWERTRHLLRLRAGLREYFPAAVEAFDDLARADSLELLGKAPDPASAARLTQTQIAAAMRRARRHSVATKAAALQTALRVPSLTQPGPVTAAFAAVTRSLVAVIAAINTEIATLERTQSGAFETHREAEIYRSRPGLGPVLAVRALGEFGDDPDRYASARARKNYAATSPITRQSGKKKTVAARFVHNDRLVDALARQAQGALVVSPGARRYYDELRARRVGHFAALRQVANRLVGILHGCLAAGTVYDENRAWGHRPPPSDGADRHTGGSPGAAVADVGLARVAGGAQR